MVTLGSDIFLEDLAKILGVNSKSESVGMQIEIREEVGHMRCELITVDQRYAVLYDLFLYRLADVREVSRRLELARIASPDGRETEDLLACEFLGDRLDERRGVRAQLLVALLNAPIVSSECEYNDIGIVVDGVIEDRGMEERAAHALNYAVGVEEIRHSVGIREGIVGRVPALSDRVADKEDLAFKLVRNDGRAVVKLNLIAPQEYVGNMMDLAQQRRGEFKDMVYLDASRVELHYEMPLNEIIYDFFDALKSRTRGYGSLDYELIGYRPSKLVKLDILLNGDIVDALSFILFADNAYPRARKICEKLKENIPRAQFEIPVQAAIGGKIIARETIKAVRKDVLAKCYGGDITRKKKLLEKQKEGKKRMRTFGTVSVPSEAFMAVLKLDED